MSPASALALADTFRRDFADAVSAIRALTLVEKSSPSVYEFIMSHR